MKVGDMVEIASMRGFMKVGDMVEAKHYTHDIYGIIIEVDGEKNRHGLAMRVKWFDGDESVEWSNFLNVVSEASNESR